MAISTLQNFWSHGRTGIAMFKKLKQAICQSKQWHHACVIWHLAL
jgi:hypothetical protein